MSVIVKGMEFPENCLKCDLRRYDANGDVYCPFTQIVCLNIGRQNNCPLVEVPEKHGRLIDADKAYDVMTYEMCGTGFQGRACCVLESELYTPTVIEAEGVEGEEK